MRSFNFNIQIIESYKCILHGSVVQPKSINKRERLLVHSSVWSAFQNYNCSRVTGSPRLSDCDASNSSRCGFKSWFIYRRVSRCPWSSYVCFRIFIKLFYISTVFPILVLIDFGFTLFKNLY